MNWDIVHHTIHFSDDTYLSPWLRLWEDEEQTERLLRIGYGRFKTFENHALSEAHWEAMCIHPIHTLTIHAGESLVYSQTCADDNLTVQTLLRIVRKEMTKRLSESKIKKYSKPEESKVPGKVPGENYLDLFYDSEPRIKLLYDGQVLSVYWDEKLEYQNGVYFF